MTTFCQFISGGPTYVLNDWHAKILHVLNDCLLFLWNLSMLHQLGQVLFSYTFTQITSRCIINH